MDRDIQELFEDNDEEIVEFIRNMRTYTIYERIDHFNKWDDAEFFRRFRLRKNTVTDILDQIAHLLLSETERYHEINPVTQLLLALRFYATGNFYIVMGDFVGIHKTTAGKIIRKVTDAIVLLRPQYIYMPRTDEQKQAVQMQFYQLANFPKVIGAIDGTHIRIQCPGGENAEYFRNRKGYFSLNVQVVCDSRHRILDIVARWPGSSHDSYIFNNSYLKTRFENGEFTDSVLLGDSAYALSNYLMTPLVNPRTPAEQRYNHSQIRTRTVVERTFGIWKRRFPVLSVGMRCHIPLCQKIIIATAVLQNITVALGDDVGELNEEINLIDEIENLHVHNNRNLVQQKYINYFETLLR